MKFIDCEWQHCVSTQRVPSEFICAMNNLYKCLAPCLPKFPGKQTLRQATAALFGAAPGWSIKWKRIEGRRIGQKEIPGCEKVPVETSTNSTEILRLGHPPEVANSSQHFHINTPSRCKTNRRVSVPFPIILTKSLLHFFGSDWVLCLFVNQSTARKCDNLTGWARASCWPLVPDAPCTPPEAGRLKIAEPVVPLVETLRVPGTEGRCSVKAWQTFFLELKRMLA